MIDDQLLEAMEKMSKAVEHTQGQFSTIRTGRASPVLVEKLLVNYYGADVPLQQLAGFQVPEARQLVIKPHDRGALNAIEKAIRDSDLGVSPSNDGVIIRINFPALTEERRKESTTGNPMKLIGCVKRPSVGPTNTSRPPIVIVSWPRRVAGTGVAGARSTSTSLKTART